MGNCWSRILGNCLPFLSSESTNPLEPASTHSSPPTMEPFQRTSVDSMGLPPPVETSQRPPADSMGFSPSLEPNHRSPVDSVLPSSPNDAIQTIREMYQEIDPVQQIDPLFRFIENRLHKIKNPSEVGSSSSEGRLATDRDSTTLAEKTIDVISIEAEKLSNSDAVEAVRSTTLNVMKGVGDLHWVFITLTVAAYAVENYLRVGSTEKEWREILVNILELAKDVNHHIKRMSDDTENLFNAVSTVVEGVVIFCDYLKRENNCRFWSATTEAAQREKTNQQLKGAKDSLALSFLQEHWDKDVFLSHSGVQKNFIRQLHRDLTGKNVSCFFDQDRNNLPLGEKWPRLIFKAAEKCKIAVVLLSKEFISSKWPMLELSTFISATKSGKNDKLQLIPIFFNIRPGDLSHIPKEWQNIKVSDDTRDKWQDALKEVRSINGIEFAVDGDEVHLRDQLVKEVCRRLGINRRPQLLDFEPVGIEQQVEHVKRLLSMEGDQSALAVIICGLGGMGKTTLAAAVVQSLDWSSTDFKFCIVAIDEKQHDKTFHIMTLQKYIIKTLGGCEPDFQSPLEGRRHIKEALKKKCCLLLIDNVVDKDYIEYLLPQDLLPGEPETKLRIIVTSRDKNVKAKLNIICEEYQVTGLSDETSKQLFLETIMQSQGGENINSEENRMIVEVAAACKGVPILLSVIGQYLRVERNTDSYQEALDVLREGNLDSFRDEGLGTKLMFVYDKIKDAEVKEAFLDICTYFHGWEWNLVADILEIRTLKDLQRRMLVSKSGSDQVIVHDILQLMGMKEARITRFSEYEELPVAVEDNLDVKGISLVKYNNTLIRIRSEQLEAMHKSLRVLMLGDWVTLDGPPCHREFKNLRYLSVGDITGFPFKDLSKLDKLKVFVNRSKTGMNLAHLPSSLKRISHQVPQIECDEFAKLPFQNLSWLKSFIVETTKSVALPEKLHLPASLVCLDLSRCTNVPKTSGHLTRSDLNILPQGFGELKKLKHLRMDYCLKLGLLSEELGNLSSLESLGMIGCRKLRALPKSLGGLISLQKLELEGCINLKQLPESFGELCISSLDLVSLENLQELPNSFGKMPLLKFLELKSCHSLKSLPDSFVQLKMLERLIIYKCDKFSILPADFGRLKCLNYMTVERCKLLKELPHGFGTLPALKTFRLEHCSSFVNLSKDFPELASLKELYFRDLHLISRFDDFEKMVTLERLVIKDCSELEGATMEKILKLQNCVLVDIKGSKKLVEKWKQMQRGIECPIVVYSGDYEADREEEKRVLRVGLLNGKWKCVEMGCNGQLVERSSVLVGLEHGTKATLALIILSKYEWNNPRDEELQRFVEIARERAETNGSAMLRIVCARHYEWYGQTPSREYSWEEDEILRSLPKGSCALSKRLTVPGEYHNESKFVIGQCVVDMEGRQSFDDFEFLEDLLWSGDPSSSEEEDNEYSEEEDNEYSEEENKKHKSIEDFIRSICSKQSQSASEDAGESKTIELIETLKSNGIDHLLVQGQKLMVDDLHGKTIGLIICNVQVFEFGKLQQIFKDVRQEDSNFLAIWIREGSLLSKDVCGHGSYTRATECWPWATFPHPMGHIYIKSPSFALLDKGGHIAIQNVFVAWDLLVGWGGKMYPFTQQTIRQSFFLMESESCLEFLLHGMNIVGRKPMKSRMTFLYTGGASDSQKMRELTPKLEELTQIQDNFEVLYVGSHNYSYIKFDERKQDYEESMQDMRWPSLSFLDAITFWYRCKFLASTEGYELYKESNLMMETETLHGLAKHLVKFYYTWLVLLDDSGVVTSYGEDVVEMICDESWDGEGNGMVVKTRVKDELMKSFSTGECTPLVKTLLTDEIDNHPLHPQHSLFRCRWEEEDNNNRCGVCSCGIADYWSPSSGKMLYCRYSLCDWFMCGSCWMAHVIQQHQ